MLQRKGVDLSNIDLNSYKAKYKELVAKKSELQENSVSIKKEIKTLQNKLNNVHNYMNDLQNRPKNNEGTNISKAQTIKIRMVRECNIKCVSYR